MQPDPAKLEAWRGFLESHKVLTGVLEGEMATETGLPLTWYDVLVNLHNAGGRLRMQELARSVLLSKSGLTRLVDRMVTANYLEREPAEGDRRGLLAVLTADGLAALRRASPVHLRGIESHFASLIDDAEAKVLRDVFTRLRDSLGECPPEPCDD
ncbi:MAG: MarR family transcriptional regulator [Actinomycetota bacterium]|nr:MarR family transcriptional regulator [Actinomycetota bacterium]